MLSNTGLDIYIYTYVMCNSLQDVNASSYTPSLTLPRVEGRLGLLFSLSLFSGRVVELNKHIYVAKICGLLNIFKSTVCLVLQSLTSTSGLNMLPNGANPNCLRGTRPQISASLHRSTATDSQLSTDWWPTAELPRVYPYIYDLADLSKLWVSITHILQCKVNALKL